MYGIVQFGTVNFLYKINFLVQNRCMGLFTYNVINFLEFPPPPPSVIILNQGPTNNVRGSLCFVLVTQKIEDCGEGGQAVIT